MKLNSFLNNEPVKRPQQRRVYKLENEAKEQQLNSKIEELEKELVKYKQIEETFEDLKRTNNKLADSHTDANILLSQSEEQNNILNIDLTQAQSKLDRLPELEETIKGLRGSLSATENELDNMQKVAHQQSSDLQANRSQIEGLKDENEQLSIQLSESVSHKVSAEQEFNSIKETFESLSNSVDSFGKENNSVKKQLKETRDMVTFWKTEAEEATLQIEQLTELERRLRQWVSDCEVAINKNKSSNENATNKNEGLQQTVAEMGNTIDELMQELSYVNAINSEYRKELSTPRYMSMGAITAKEGITMPLVKENLRKKFLGNSAPTLLKFKRKEIA